MTLVLVSAVLLSVFLALNIGANNSAAAMATAFGAGARTKREAVGLIAVFALIGALIAGGPVIKTLGKGLVSETVMSSHVGLVFIVLFVSALFISWANLMRVPIATTHAIVCAVVGVGLYAEALNGRKFLDIVVWWISTPIVAWCINYVVGRYFYFRTIRWLTRFPEERLKRIFSFFLTISGCYVAFSAGSNNAANAVGPIVGIGLIDSGSGAILGGIGLGVGALLLGGRVIETVGKEITEICLVRAISVEFIGASLVLAASVFGIPVSMAEIITAGIIGFSCASQGVCETARNRHVARIAFFWFVAPILSVGLTYFLVDFYFKFSIGV